MFETYLRPAVNETEIIQVIDEAYSSQIESNMIQQSPEIFFRALNLLDIKTKNHLLSYVAKTLEFPDYFGQNWDALDECLIDMPSYSPMAKGFFILIKNVDDLFIHGKRELLSLLAALHSAGSSINFQDKKPFYVRLECLPGEMKQHLTEFCQKNSDEKDALINEKS